MGANRAPMAKKKRGGQKKPAATKKPTAAKTATKAAKDAEAARQGRVDQMAPAGSSAPAPAPEPAPAPDRLEIRAAKLDGMQARAETKAAERAAQVAGGTVQEQPPQAVIGGDPEFEERDDIREASEGTAPAAVSGGGEKPKLFYWGLKARGQLPIWILEAGGVEYEWEKDPGDFKTYATFGQLPFLTHGETNVAQSMAITRYCSKLAGLEGTDKDWTTSEIMLEEQNDLFDLFVAAKYRHAEPDSIAAWVECMEVKLPAQFATLEGLVSESGFFGSKMCAGDIGIASMMNFALDHAFDFSPYPKLSALHGAVCALPGIAKHLKTDAPSVYFTPPPAAQLGGSEPNSGLELVIEEPVAPTNKSSRVPVPPASPAPVAVSPVVLWAH